MNGVRVCMLVFLAGICRAEKISLVRGRVESSTAFFGNELVAELQCQSRAMPGFQSSVTSDGRFEFRDVTSGMYVLRITNNQGAVLKEQLVDIVSYTNELSVELPKRKIERPVNGLVSVTDLRRQVPPKAFRAFADAQKDAHSGREQEAVRKLQRAIEIYPNYSDARCNLGVEYIRLRRYPEALDQFQKALAAGPPSAVLYANLAYALIAVGRLSDAESAARQSVAMNDSYVRGHYILGHILSKSVTPGSLAKAPEAAKELRLGAAEIPHAYLLIAEMYLAEGDRAGAAEEIKFYLKSKDNTFRPGAESMLARLAGK